MEATKYNIFEKNGYKAVSITWAKDKKVRKPNCSQITDPVKPLGRCSATNTPNKSRPGISIGTAEYSYFTPVRVSIVAGRDPGRLDGKLLPPTHFLS